MGRPSSFTQEAADMICERIAGGASLRSICAEEGGPEMRSVFRWLEANESFRQQYARAREAQADTLADEILDIADDGRNDTYTDDEGRELPNYDVIARSRLRVDARKWIAAKLKPKVYGDSVRQTVTGLNDGPIQTSLTVEFVRAAAVSGEA